MTTIAQRSFASGVLTPSLHSRTNFIRYSQGLRQGRNAFVMRHGGITNRPGTEFICEAKDSSKDTRLLTFTTKTGEQFVLEIGHEYIRFIKDGVQLRETATSLDSSSITKANPAVVSETGHGYSDGDEVYLSGVGGMLEVNNRNYIISSAATNSYQLTTLGGTVLDSSGFTAAGTDGEVAKVYEIATSYASTDVFNLNFSISNDEMYLFHPDYPVQKLSKGATDTSWAIVDETYKPDQCYFSTFTATSAITGTAGSDKIKYKFTGIIEGTGEETLPLYSDAANKAISSITKEKNPVVTTSGTHGYEDKDEVRIETSGGMTQLNARNFEILKVSNTSFRILDVDTTTYDTFSSGDAYLCTHSDTSLDGSQAITITFPSMPTVDGSINCISINIYREEGGYWGFVGSTADTSFIDVSVAPDTSIEPPKDPLLFLGADDYPSTGSFIQQRLVIAASNNEPDKIWLSKIGEYNTFAPNDILTSDSAFAFSLAGTDNFIRHTLDLGKPMMLVNNGEWTLLGRESGLVTPDEINPSAQTYNGVGTLKPVIVGGNALYVQDRGTIVRDLFFDYSVDGYNGDDLTISANHLFDGFSINDWCYQQVPHSIIWTIRSDGELLALTYVKDQQVIAWTQNDFNNGLAKSVTNTKGTLEDNVYVVVERTIDGETQKHIEKFSTRNLEDLTEANFMDASLVYDGRNTTATTMTLTSGGTYTTDDDLTCTASTSFFSADDIGNRIDLTDGETPLRCLITAYTSATVVTVRVQNIDIPLAQQNNATTSWSKAVAKVYGAWQLEGRDVSIYADGYVIASPNNDAYGVKSVSNGTVTLAQPYAYIRIGEPYITDVETLDIDLQGNQTISDKKINISSVVLHVEETLGVFAGTEQPTGTDPLNGLFELKLRDAEDYESQVTLKTGKIDINLKSRWNDNGRVFIRQVDPVPMTILAISPSGNIPIG